MAVNKKTMVRKKQLRQARLDGGTWQKQRDALKAKKRQRFVDLAKQRVTKAVAAIELIGKLSNRTHYEYTNNDIAIITKALADATDHVLRAFRNQGKDLSTINFGK